MASRRSLATFKRLEEHGIVLQLALKSAVTPVSTEEYGHADDKGAWLVSATTSAICIIVRSARMPRLAKW